MTDSTSVGHFRAGWPGSYLRDHFSDQIDVFVHTIEQVDVWDVISLSKFDIIHYNRLFGMAESTDELHNLLRDAGVKMVMDIDDHWIFPEEFSIVSEVDLQLNIFKNVDHITTTTDLFRDELLEFNENVTVLPNAIDLDHRMWKFKDDPSDVVRVAWLGSFKRHQDLFRMKDSIEKLYADPELGGKFVFVQVGGEQVDNEIFDGPGFEWIKSVLPFEYGKYYSGVDICLAPLKENVFSLCKSEIKMVEAGMNKKAFICQDYGIYQKHITHKKTGLLVKDDDDWYTYIKMLILDKDLRIALAQNLHDYVNPKFAMKTIAKQRIEFYKKIMNEKLV